MTKLIAGITLVFLSWNTAADGIGTYSEGLRMGQLTDFSEKGLLRSGEGELLIGNASTVLKVPYTYQCGSEKEPETCVGERTINPWKFSVDLSNKDLVQQLKNAKGKYVVLKYKHSMIQNPFANDTNYVITGVEEVQKSESPAEPCQAGHAGSGRRADGNSTGRIVKVSQQGLWNKSWEIEMQVGDSGNEFTYMSVRDQDMAKCMMDYLKTGTKVSLDYNQSYFHNPLGRRTTFDVLQVAPVEQPAAVNPTVGSENATHDDATATAGR